MAKVAKKSPKPPGVVALLEKNASTLIEALQVRSLSSASQRRAARRALLDITTRLAAIADDLDNVRVPTGVFDPADPKVVGRIVALAFLAQPRLSLEAIGDDRFYGAGVYGLYYTGNYAPYKPIVSKEHPIYVGKADPATQTAKTVRDQGEKLASRLKDHKKSVTKADNLRASDFECRILVVASGYQDAAEKHLINLYKPVWNKETKIAYGIGKHGDAPTTRGNKRSPWDTLHSGRNWAIGTTKDQLSADAILLKLKDHFEKNKPYATLQAAVRVFLAQMTQS